MESQTADQLAWAHVTSESPDEPWSTSLRDALSRITFIDLAATSRPLATLVSKANESIDQYGQTSWRPLLVIAGRGRGGSSNSSGGVGNSNTSIPGSTHGVEMAKLLAAQGQQPEVGAEIRKTVGDVAAVLAISTAASIMVVQAGSEVVHHEAV